jgi:hypothetical protein
VVQAGEGQRGTVAHLLDEVAGVRQTMSREHRAVNCGYYAFGIRDLGEERSIDIVFLQWFCVDCSGVPYYAADWPTAATPLPSDVAQVVSLTTPSALFTTLIKSSLRAVTSRSAQIINRVILRARVGK